MKKLVAGFLLVHMWIPMFADENMDFYTKMISYIPPLVGKQELPTVNRYKYNNDCSGFVAFLFHAAGLNLLKIYGQGQNGVTAIWNGLKQKNLILENTNLQIGDIVFFDNTYDMNRNGIWDDEFSHIGVVESIDEYDTITYVHYGSQGVVRAKMNLKHPNEFINVVKGQAYRYNDLLRNSSKRGVNPKYLSGSLYRGAARIPVTKMNNQ